MKLLLDENLSPRLVARLAELGVYIAHVAHLGRAGLSDPALFRYAFEQDMTVVTINAADFLTLAADCELHPGVIVLRVSGLPPTSSGRTWSQSSNRWQAIQLSRQDCSTR